MAFFADWSRGNLHIRVYSVAVNLWGWKIGRNTWISVELIFLQTLGQPHLIQNEVSILICVYVHARECSCSRHCVFHVGYFYNPELYTNISGIFRQYCSKSQHRDQRENSSDSSSEFKDERQAGQTFTPRVVPLESLLARPMAPCRDYEMLPCSKKQVHLTDIQLSRSMQFLLKVGSELIDITVEELYSSLVMVEASFRKRTLLPLQRFLKLQHP